MKLDGQKGLDMERYVEDLNFSSIPLLQLLHSMSLTSRDPSDYMVVKISTT